MTSERSKRRDFLSLIFISKSISKKLLVIIIIIIIIIIKSNKGLINAFEHLGIEVGGGCLFEDTWLRG